MALEQTLIRRALWQAAAIALIGLVISLGINQFRSQGLPLVGDWSPEARITDRSGESLVIPPEQAKSLFESGKVFFLDARSADDYQAGHIQGALNLPWQEFDTHFERIMPDIPEDRVIVTYCEGETCELSKDLARALIEMGFSNVRVLVNGWSVWKNMGQPVAVGGTP
ncbi:MAG: rhodanese-like domain-containing protein [Desulfobacterales bacterium]